MSELDRKSLRKTETKRERPTRPDTANGAPAARLLGLQRAAGNHTVVGLLRQAAPGQAPVAHHGKAVAGEQGSPTFEKLSHRLWEIEKQLVALNATAMVAGERLDLSAKVQAWLTELGTPGERSEAQIADLSRQVDEFERKRSAEHDDVAAWWKELTVAYEDEQSRLSRSKERSDVIASDLLKESYTQAGERMLVSGRFARPEDGTPFAIDLYERHHVQKGWERAVNESIVTGERAAGKGEHKDAGHWPWKVFEVEHHLVHGGHAGFEEQEKAIKEAVDSAIRHNVHEAVEEMVELGESPDAAKAWADSALEKARTAAEELLEKAGGTAEAAGRWAGRLHIAGILLVGVDFVGSGFRVWASPPKERPKGLIPIQGVAGV